MKKSTAILLVGLATLAVIAGPTFAQVPASPPTPPSPPATPLPPVPRQFALAENDVETDLDAAASQLAASQAALANSYSVLGEKAFLFPGHPAGADGNLVIPKDASDAQSLADMDEDL